MKQNQVIVASSGFYSDYSLDGVYIVLKDFDFDIELKEFEKENPLKEHKYKWGKGLVWDDPKHIEFFVERGLIKKVPYNEVHTNAYDYEVKPENIQNIARD